MSQERDAAALERFRPIYDAVSRGDTKPYLDHLDEDVEVHQPAELLGTKGTFRGKEGTSDTTFEVTVPCGVTATPNSVSSTCELTTTADALYGDPNTALEGKRAIWELGRVQVWDGGSDGDVETAEGNSLFMTQGVFVP